MEKVLQVYNPDKHFVETSRPPSSLRLIRLDHMNSFACPHCNTAESKKSSCLLCLLRRSPCEPV